MNLTKCFVAGLCISALTASAGMIKSNAFESVGEDGTGWTFGGQTWETTGIRVANDTTNNRASYSNDATNRPYASADNTTVLALNTEGGIWTNTVDASFLVTANVFADMLVKFVPSEELPSIDAATVKMAVAVVPNGTSTNLAVSVFDQDGQTNKWIISATTIDPLLWYRLTVQLNYNSGNYELYATVKINGVSVNAQPYYLNNPDNKLNSIGFSGTGFIDEVVVRNDDPFVTEIPLTLSFSTGVDSVLVSGNSKTNGATVLSGDSLEITAKTWYEIKSVTGTGVTTEWTSGNVSNKVGTVKVTAGESAVVTIEAQRSTSTAAVGGSTSFTNQPMNKVAAWAIAKGLTGDVTEPMYNRYLLGIDDVDGTVPALLIKSIAVSDTTVTVTVEATGVNFETGMNGTLKIKCYETLGGTPVVFAPTVTGSTTASVTQNIGTAKFVKVVVE